MPSSTAKTKHLNIRTSEDEYRRISEFARFQGKTLSGFALESMWQQIEDWEDIQAVKEYEQAKAGGGLDLISHEDAMRELGLR
ncbi:MAG: DUF1778 domain-containing protein [Coriobacteriales bacterium]|nr:DUF1778 domain-containing protein [Coriobacteriales bacterium]